MFAVAGMNETHRQKSFPLQVNCKQANDGREQKPKIKKRTKYENACGWFLCSSFSSAAASYLLSVARVDAIIRILSFNFDLARIND